MHDVRRRAHQDGGLEVAHDLQLPLGVARRGRDDGDAHPLQPGVHAEAPGGQAVLEADLRHVVRVRAAGHRHPGAQLGPGVEVAPAVAHHRRVGDGAR